MREEETTYQLDPPVPLRGPYNTFSVGRLGGSKHPLSHYLCANPLTLQSTAEKLCDGLIAPHLGNGVGLSITFFCVLNSLPIIAEQCDNKLFSLRSIGFGHCRQDMSFRIRFGGTP
mgnify:CR=1 FL=1